MVLQARRACVLAAITLAAASVAEEPKNVDPLSSLRFFIGTWDGELAGPDGKGVRVQYVVTTALKDRWIKGSGDFSAIGVAVEDFWGVDSQTGKLIRSIFQSTGLNGNVYSSGWNGDVLLWEGTVYVEQKPMKVRETITRTGPDAFTAVWESETSAGKWEAYSREKFSRARSTAKPGSKK